jgi:hypothetical protein
MGLFSKILNRCSKEPKMECQICGKIIRQKNVPVLIQNGTVKTVCDKCYLPPEPVCALCGRCDASMDMDDWVVSISKDFGIKTICSSCVKKHGIVPLL